MLFEFVAGITSTLQGSDATPEVVNRLLEIGEQGIELRECRIRRVFDGTLPNLDVAVRDRVGSPFRRIGTVGVE